MISRGVGSAQLFYKKHNALGYSVEYPNEDGCDDGVDYYLKHRNLPFLQCELLDSSAVSSLRPFALDPIFESSWK